MKDSLETPDAAPVDEQDAPEEAPDVPAEEAPAEVPVEAEAAPGVTAAPKAPVDNTIVVQGNKPPASAQEFENEAALFADDMQRGHIKPETMQELYGKKDTLGKVGTLFGLLVSGMGSGLSGQPNAVLQMMNQEIERDLDAQKASNQNAQNWLRLSQAHQRQKAEIPQIEAQTKQANAETSLVPYRQAQMESQTKQAKAETSLMPYRQAELAASAKAHNAMADVSATTAAKNYMVIDMTRGLQDLYNKAPPGATKDAMGKYINDVIVPARDAQIKQNSLDGANKINAIHAITQPPQKPTDVQKVDVSLVPKLNAQARMYESQGLPVPQGSIPSSQVPTVLKEAGDINANRASYKVIRDAFEKYDKQIAGGINKLDKDAVKVHISGQLKSAGIPKDMAEELATASLPAIMDIGATRQTKADQLYDQFKTREEGATTLRQYPSLYPPFPGPPKVSHPAKKGGAAKAAPDKASGGKQYKVVGGIKYKRGPKGEAIKVD